GYHPEGYCGLEHTMSVARRVKQAGLGFMLAFHYSDTWADPGKQYKPAAWKDLNRDELVKALGDYTRDTLRQFGAQGTMPSIVAIGNEVTHGMLWDYGYTEKDWPYFARLLKEAYQAVKDVDPRILVTIHIERGQRLELTKWFAEQLVKHDVPYDVLSISCYAPDPNGLKANLLNYIRTHGKPVILAEYADPKREMNEAVYALPNGMGLGTVVWEPTVARRRASPLFDESGATLPEIKLYSELREKFTTPRAWPTTHSPESEN
ncbi:MAG TPA: glycosyl hydrolase 53 family protein, partial [Sedimentisphaerales bacterium]|nr:glycosyl hydrolase 53 family protein [Sedimentisphaerales bacterium]